MRIHKQFFKSIALPALLVTGLAGSSIAQDSTIVNPETEAPVILSTSPAGGEMNVALNSVIEITFNSDMDESSINGNTLLLHGTEKDTMYKKDSEVKLYGQITDMPEIKESQGSWEYTTGVVSGTISYSNKIAVFTPDSELKEGIQYTFTVTSEVKSSEHVALENDHEWSFTTIGTPDSIPSDKEGMGKTEDR